MNEDQFDKLFKYMERRFDDIDKRFDKVEASIDRLATTVDHLIEQYDRLETERLARDAQFERLLAWAEKVSKKTGIPLEI